MKKSIGLILTISLVTTNLTKAANVLSVFKEELKDEADSLSYALGLNTGTAYRANLDQLPGGELAKGNKFLAKAFEAGLSHDTTKYLMSEREANLFILEYLEKQDKKAKQLREKAYLQQKPANDQYMAKKLKEKGYIELLDAPKGASYGTIVKMEKKGTGPVVSDTDFVCINYRSTLSNGTVFDESTDNSAVFPIDGVIEGLKDALETMRKGAKATVVVPPELGYGTEEIGDGKIPANSILIYDVEVMDIFHTEDDATLYLEKNGFDTGEDEE